MSCMEHAFSLSWISGLVITKLEYTPMTLPKLLFALTMAILNSWLCLLACQMRRQLSKV